MRKHSLIFLVSVLLFPAYASAFYAEVIPDEIEQGGAFILKAAADSMPAASFSGRPLHFSECSNGCFIAIGAIDLEAEPGEYYVALAIGEKRKEVKFRVKSSVFETLKLTLPEDKVSLSPENLKRAEDEAERLRSILQKVSERLWKGSFILPLENPVSTAFGAKRIINQKKVSVHKGIDIKGKHGEIVKASNNGRIVLSEELFFGGKTLVIDHGHSIFTIYMHLSDFNVKSGDAVSKGDIIGYVGSTGRASGPHLHFGVKVSGTTANPLSFVNLNLQ